MWTRTHSKTVTDVSAQQLWNVWTDVNQWHTWQPDIERATLDGPFEQGNTFTLKPAGASPVKIELVTVEPGKRFTDLTRFPGARMYGDHEFVQQGNALEIRTTMRVEGPLGFLWRKLVAEAIVNSMPQQTDQLLARATHG
jgi:uncharacterized protein YndB with AHSA1/START domain